jgi:hypothetical protein
VNEPVTRPTQVTGATNPQNLMPVPLAANRFSYFFKRKRNLHYWNVSPKVFQLTGQADETAIRTIANQLIHNHDGLRLTLEQTSDGSWKQLILPPDIDAVYCGLRYKARTTEPLTEWVASQLGALHAGFTFPGPLFRVVQLTDDVSGTSLLSFVTHHLVGDAQTARMITRDFIRNYDVLNGLAPKPTVQPPSYAQYVKQSVQYWKSHSTEEQTYWSKLPWDEIRSLPARAGLSQNIEQFTVAKSYPLKVPNIAEFLKAARHGKFEFVDFLLASIARAYGQWTGHEVLCLAMVFHGRDDPAFDGNLNSVAGWFSEPIPLLLPTSASLIDLLGLAHSQRTRASVRGKSYGVARYLTSADEFSPFATHPEPEISLNVVLPSLLKLRSDRNLIEWDETVSIPATMGSTQRAFVLSGGFSFGANDMRLSWDFSSKILDEEEIAKFGQNCLRELVEAVSSLGVFARSEKVVSHD